ncbi:hypothetical protein LGL08_23060 [Clostridium estertheticum]|uniref:hypothetical protein n=1 Tax=Clostridium estertheticum TaxID=238834 RepID=UPI001CF2949E|nr:hypothetical protein [Clostridium estertheticum]MCB2309428.1 hypothetical protein [Clostridium estertheticum]MCB2347856.1 hypothetical protein [Clostridium estertheticum]MCB2352383.1 hypothetical protein [Clostridium estertheticum]WAG48573.1 hypothetical protein LL127_23765 [Clostridium estertheticum]
MEKELKYLGNQTLFNNYTDELYQIIKDEYNQTQARKYGSTLPIAIDSFGFGVMIGKKIERKIHKKTKIKNDSMNKKYDELLKKEKVLMLKLEKAENLISRIKVMCENTSAFI